MLKRLFLGFLISLFIFNNAYAVGWLKAKPAGTDSASDIDTLVQANNNALDLVLSTYRQGLQITYASAATLTVGAGGVVCNNSDGSLRLMVAKSSSTTVSWTNIDTGSEAASTTYYLYAISSAITDTTFTIKISTNSSAPTVGTYYRRLGSFYNDSSGNITNISNDDAIKPSIYDSGWFAVSVSTSYAKTHSLGTTKVMPVIMLSDNSDGSGNCQIIGTSYADINNGTYLVALTATTITIRTSAVYITSGINTTGAQWIPTSGYARILLIALE